eukprot:scaffold449_cov241-Pinguiococcus_pyrenoidosus.AAC.23
MHSHGVGRDLMLCGERIDCACERLRGLEQRVHLRGQVAPAHALGWLETQDVRSLRFLVGRPTPGHQGWREAHVLLNHNIESAPLRRLRSPANRKRHFLREGLKQF